MLSKRLPLSRIYSGFLNLEVTLDSCFQSLEAGKKEVRGFWSNLSLFKKKVKKKKKKGGRGGRMLCTAIESDLAYLWLFYSQGQLNKHCACRRQEKLVLNKSNCPRLLKNNIMELPSLSWGAKMVARLLIYQIRISENMELSSVLKGHKSKQSFVSGIEEVFLY